MSRIKILIADPNEAVRKGIGTALLSQEDMMVVGHSGDGADALSLIDRIHPDVAVLDVALPIINGFCALKRIRELRWGTKVVLMSLYKQEAYVHQAVVCGAYGFVLKPNLTPDVIHAVRMAAHGGFYLSKAIRSSGLTAMIDGRTDTLHADSWVD